VERVCGPIVATGVTRVLKTRVTPETKARVAEVTQEQRLNIRKATLRGWRAEFARHLRAQGIAANATERAVRVEPRTHKLDGIYRASIRGHSTHMRACSASMAADLNRGNLRIEPGTFRLAQTRKSVESGWGAIADMLVTQGQLELATQVQRFLDHMPRPRTDREGIRRELCHRVPAHEVRDTREPVRALQALSPTLVSGDLP